MRILPHKHDHFLLALREVPDVVSKLLGQLAIGGFVVLRIKVRFQLTFYIPNYRV